VTLWLSVPAVFSLSESGLARTAAVATSPMLATLFSDTEDTEQAQRATEKDKAAACGYARLRIDRSARASTEWPRTFVTRNAP